MSNNNIQSSIPILTKEGWPLGRGGWRRRLSQENSKIRYVLCNIFYALFFICYSVLSTNAQNDSTSTDTIPEPPKKILFTGYIKDLQSASFINDANQIATGSLIHNRLIFKYYAPAGFTFDAEMRNRLYYGEEISSNPAAFSQSIGADNGYFDLSKKIINANSLVLYSQIDRLNLNWHSSAWDVTVGRQRINWGVALAWNPNDVFNAYNLLDFDYEERPGNDAVRIQHYFASGSSLELAAKPGRNPDENIVNALYKFNTHSYDIQFLGGLYNKDLDIGTGWAGNLWNAGFKGEVSYFHSKNKFTDTTGTVEVSISIDQSWDPGWYASFSALYNSTGQTTVFNLTALRNTTLDASNLLPFRYSFLPGIQKTFNPLVSGNFTVLYAPGLNAVVFLPTLTYSISNTWTLDFVVQSFFATLSNKFQTAGNAVYLRLRWSF